MAGAVLCGAEEPPRGTGRGVEVPDSKAWGKAAVVSSVFRKMDWQQC